MENASMKFQPSVLLEGSKLGRVASLGDHFTFFLPALLLADPWMKRPKITFC